VQLTFAGTRVVEVTFPLISMMFVEADGCVLGPCMSEFGSIGSENCTVMFPSRVADGVTLATVGPSVSDEDAGGGVATKALKKKSCTPLFALPLV
jgi:hypothetical protein